METYEPNAVQQPAEKAEQTAEQTPKEKTYTQAEVNAMMGRRLSRQEAQIRGEYEPLVNVLKVGTGKESLSEITAGLTEFYKGKGMEIPSSKPGGYSERDIAFLASKDAEEFIQGGDEEVAAEVDRLAKLGPDKMTPREKELYKNLGKHRTETERGRKLSQIGVPEDVWRGEEFRSFASQFTASTPIEKVYEIFEQTKPKAEVKNMGSMRTTTAGDTGVKDYYSPEEARKFTKADLDKDPKLYEAVRRSMAKWK